MQSPESVKRLNHRRTGLLVVLFVGLCSVYMLTFGGRIESTDTLFLFDATSSLVQFGDTRLDTSAGVRPSPPHQLPMNNLYPLPDVGAERLQIVLAAPLFWLVQHVPGLGLVHGVYLFNVLVSAAACCVICQYALVLGYSERVGVLAALLMGLGTILWPYSKTFFQEPLALLFILIAALCLEKWRIASYRRPGWLLLAVVTVVAAVMSKVAAVLAVPGLMIIAAPRLSWRQVVLLVFGLALLVVIVIALREPLGISSARVERTLSILRRPGRYFASALHGYLLSVGGSVWGTSPVILLALPGAWFSRQVRYLTALLLVALSFALVYALWQGENWFGGLSWPPRFLIPVIPFGIIAALPALDRALRRPFPKLPLALIGALFAYGIWIQLSGVSLRWNEYLRGLPPEANGLGEWSGGLNLVAYLRWVVIPSLWSQSDLDFAWARVGAYGWPLVCGALVAVCGWLGWRLLRGGAVRRWFLWLLPPAFAALAVLCLGAIASDPLYSASDQSLQAMLPILERETQPGDVVVLSDLVYERFFTQHARANHPRIVGLPFQPGEQPSPEQPPEIVSDNPDVLVHVTTGPLIYALAEGRNRLFVLASSGPFLPWSVRPVERFMAAHYFPIREIETGPQVRLIEYSAAAAPDPYGFMGPTYTTDLNYGGDIRLIGFELPAGTTYAPGDALPVALYWQTDARLNVNYKVAWFVRAADGSPLVQGWDTEPGAGFLPTTGWLPNAPLWDNRALRLPENTPPGDYRLWVVLYITGEDGSIINLPVTGSETIEGYIGVLPAIITVSG